MDRVLVVGVEAMAVVVVPRDAAQMLRWVLSGHIVQLGQVTTGSLLVAGRAVTADQVFADALKVGKDRHSD